MKNASKNGLKLTALATAMLTLGACGGAGSGEVINVKPSYLGDCDVCQLRRHQR